MTTLKKTRKRTNLSIKLANDAINFQFDVELPILNWWWVVVLLAAIMLVLRPELTDYIKAVISLIRP